MIATDQVTDRRRHHTISPWLRESSLSAAVKATHKRCPVYWTSLYMIQHLTRVGPLMECPMRVTIKVDVARLLAVIV
ncbi:hypothetical protein CHELA40_13440 [Chelatococcus asaccharovorans]|nr:hypothetical protein CHELA40_13440 [Chelatococcus asaccharovorans]CAH1678010.1 hypothetical protein CHELA17_62180 [Chelatococcus asaccharovorans]